MPIKPQIKTLTNSSVDILNAIRNNATNNYRDYVPIATANAESIREIGTVIMDNPSLQNEFLTALVNRIGRVIMTSKMYSNPWSRFKKGLLEFGETIEEIFVNIAKPFQFDQEEAESKVFKREIPDVRSAFHVLNYKKFYKATVSQDQLRTAFLSWNGISELISKIVDAMYTGANYDEYQTMKYMVAMKILKGHMNVQEIDAVSDANMKSIVADIKTASNDLTFLSDKNNLAGVYNATEKANQYLIVNTAFDSKMDVEVLASAFNMDKAEFMGHRILIDGFGNLDTERLNELFDGDATYHEITTAEKEALNTIPVVLIDENFFMIFDNMYNFTEQYNGEGLYWNYWYHTWKTFSVSPFANNRCFVPATPTVSAVAVTPSTATVSAGQVVQLSAEVTTTNFAPQSVKWTVESGTATVTQTGLVKIGDSATGTVKVRATSTFDTTKKADVTLTIA